MYGKERNPFSPSSLLFMGLPLPLPPPVADKASIDPEDTEKKLRILQMDLAIDNAKNADGGSNSSSQCSILYSTLCPFCQVRKGESLCGELPNN